MDIFDKESEIIEFFQTIVSPSETLLIPGNEETEQVFQSIFDEKSWTKWTDTSGKNDPPPDFYCDEYGLMMDVMRVDDHGYISEKGKMVNPTLTRESEVTRELQEKGILGQFPGAKLHLLVDTKLPTEEDHNYRFYRDNFVRTVETHKKKIHRYKENHPSCKVIFFVFDESSAYMETPYKSSNPVQGQLNFGRVHFWFNDSSFIKVLQDSDIDYLVWFTPYKMIEFLGNGLKLPRAVVYNIKELPQEQFEYNEDRMMSVEV
mgnify:FL=1